MPDMLDAFLKSVDSLDLSVIDKIDLPARPEQLEPIPTEYLDGRVGRWLGSVQFAATRALRGYNTRTAPLGQPSSILNAAA